MATVSETTERRDRIDANVRAMMWRAIGTAWSWEDEASWAYDIAYAIEAERKKRYDAEDAASLATGPFEVPLEKVGTLFVDPADVMASDFKAFQSTPA